MTAQQQRELDANTFATYLLIPEDQLRAEIAALGGFDLCMPDKDFNALCRKFGVSNATMAYRFYLLGRDSK